MRIFQYIIALVLLLLVSSKTNAQTVISGIIADSVSLEPLQGTAVKLKRSGKGTVTDEKGAFTIIAASYDTLLITRVGYQPYEYPFFESERDILILIREEVRNLQEVVVNVYADEKPVHSTPRQVKALSLAEAFSSPFTYLSKSEKEKRMLVRYQQEQQKVQTFLDVITSAEFKNNIITTFSISEDQYYDILIAFNTEKRSVHYLTDELDIKQQIEDYFRKKVP